LLTIDEWCALNRISRRTFYNLLRDGQGPKLTRIRGAVRISREANRRWQKRMAKGRAKPPPRKPGPQPKLLLAVKERMRAYVANGRNLAALTEEAMSAEFAASRDTCRRARKEIVGDPRV
jgi:hypothetical protein